MLHASRVLKVDMNADIYIFAFGHTTFKSSLTKFMMNNSTDARESDLNSEIVWMREIELGHSIVIVMINNRFQLINGANSMT